MSSSQALAPAPKALASLSQGAGHFIPKRTLAWLVKALPAWGLDGLRENLLRAAGVKLGVGSRVFGRLSITGLGRPGSLLTLGDFVLVADGVKVDLHDSVRVGSFVRIERGVSLLTHNVSAGTASIRGGSSRSGPIVIEDGAWLGSNCSVLPGVTIGAGAVVAGNAVVTHSVNRKTLVAGAPARLVDLL